MKKESSDYMFELKDGLIIAPNHIKKEILKTISKQKKLINIKIMTKEEFIKNYYGTYKKEALYFLMQKFNLNYKTAQKYLDNLFINSKVIKPYFDVLKNKNLLEINQSFKDNLNHITIIGYKDIDPYLLNELKNYDLEIIHSKTGCKTPVIHEFNSQTDELIFIAEDIINKIQNENIDINDIFVSGITNDYKSELIRIFNLFKIPFNFQSSYSLYSSKIAQDFLKSLNETKDLQASLDLLPASNLKNQIIDVLNNLSFPNLDDTAIQIITAKLQNITVEKEEVTNAIQIINLNQITNPNKHYYIAGLNQGIIPHIYKDDDIITDKEKVSLGLLTSLQKNEIAKNHLKHLIKTFSNLTLSYKLKDAFNTYFPSFVISELNLEVQKEHQISYEYSNDFNKLKLGILLDNYFNYNEKDTSLPLLSSAYPSLPYGTYSNEYNKVNQTLLKNHLKNNLTLSYTSLNNYALCPFKFYIKHILKLEPYEETFPLLIGNLFHNTLSHLYDENFDLEKEYYGYLKDKSLTPKESFYIDKLYQTLKQDIDIIRWQETHSQYKNHLTEKPVKIDKSKDINITFTGIIDKINYFEENNQINAIIIDYKTGEVSSTLDDINYGLNMQLPTYIYLVQKGLGPNYTINGFYLQKVLTPQTLDSKDADKDTKNNLKLQGYTINNEDTISKIDDTYQNSEIISSMKTTQKGFYAYAKVIDKDGINKLVNIVDNNISATIEKILNADFKIEPKRIDNKNISCKFCPFKDICYVKETDIKDLKETRFKDIIGGEENA